MGLLFLLAVGIRTWSASQDVNALQREYQAIGQKLSSGLAGPIPNPMATTADRNEQFAVLRDRMRAQNRVDEAPLAAGLALIVIVAGLGADGPPGRTWRPQNVVTRGSSADQSTLCGVLERAGRKVWILGHSLSMAAVSLVAVFYCGSVGFLLFRGSAITPSLFDAALSRTIDAIVTLAIYCISAPYGM